MTPFLSLKSRNVFFEVKSILFIEVTSVYEYLFTKYPIQLAISNLLAMFPIIQSRRTKKTFELKESSEFKITASSLLHSPAGIFFNLCFVVWIVVFIQLFLQINLHSSKISSHFSFNYHSYSNRLLIFPSYCRSYQVTKNRYFKWMPWRCTQIILYSFECLSYLISFREALLCQ